MSFLSLTVTVPSQSLCMQGRVVSTIKSSGILGSLNPQTISISPDTAAIRQRKDEKSQQSMIMLYCMDVDDYLQLFMCLMPSLGRNWERGSPSTSKVTSSL